MRWRAKLEGNDGDLASLTEVLPTGEVRVVFQDDAYWLIAEVDEGDLGEVMERLAVVLGHVNGLAIAFDRKQRPVRLTGDLVEDESGAKHRVVQLGTAEGRVRLPKPTILTDPPQPAPPPPGPIIMAHRSEPAVDDVLRLLGTHPHDFFTLYKVVEIIQQDMRGDKPIVSAGLATAADLDAFGASANNRQVSGDLARHAVDKGGPPKRTMTLGEARVFVLALVTRWLHRKAGL